MSDQLNQKLRDRANTFAEDIAAIVRDSIAQEVMRLVGVQQQAAQGQKGAKRGPKPKAAKAASPGPGRKRRVKISDEQVLSVIRGKKAGLSVHEIAAATGIRGEPLSYRINKLRAAKKVRTSGKTTKMRYFAVD